MLHCTNPKCNRIIMDKTADGGWKLRTRMVLFTDTGAVALCPSCKTPVTVPVGLTDEPDTLPKPRLSIKA